jgi:hypothetical protein
VNDGAKPHDVLEAQAAIFWKTELDEGRVSSEQAAAWIDALCQATARQYWGKLGSDAEKMNEITLLAPLAKATVQYAFANADSLGLPPSFVQWTKNQAGSSNSIASGAEALSAADKLGLLDPSFVAKLALCFSRKG